MTPEQLLEQAREAMTHAYAPYSRFYVGAALLCADGASTRSNRKVKNDK